MKIIAFLLTFLFIESSSFAQTVLYTANDGVLNTEKTVKSELQRLKSSLPPGKALLPVIYHKLNRNDTVINYIRVAVTNEASEEGSDNTEFKYEQDSTFLLIGKQLPSFELTDLDGNKVSSESLKGKPTLINFWATYCGPCIVEMPALSKLKDKYKEEINFVSIAEEDDKVYHLKAFLKDKGFNFPVLDKGVTYKSALKLSALPKNLFIDKNGILRHIQNNYPIDEQRNTVPLDSQDNRFVKILEELIKEEI